MKKKIVFGLFFILIVFATINWRLIDYGIMQGKGQWHVLSNAIPVNDFLADPNVPDSIKQKLRLIQEVLSFAVDSLSLQVSKSYSTIYDQRGEDILWNVSASKAFELEAYEWSFPILGKFSYKGFFDFKKAQNEEQALKDQGYDTRVRPVGGWSTLGWFNDPILSNMLNRQTGDLVELIIHELTHGTLYIKDSVDFNENLATFVGQKGAETFLEFKYGINSPEIIEYRIEREDNKRFVNHMLNGADLLDSLYKSLSLSENTSSKSKRKEYLIKEICISIDTISFRNSNYLDVFQDQLPNNTYFLSIRRYRSKLNDFENEYKSSFSSDLRKYIIDLKITTVPYN